MSKKARETGITDKSYAKLHKICKKTSHTGAKPLVAHIDQPNVMVTQKVRKAQEARRG